MCVEIGKCVKGRCAAGWGFGGGLVWIVGDGTQSCCRGDHRSPADRVQYIMILGVFADAAVSAFLFGRKFAETAGQREINAALSEACGVPYGREDVPGVFIGAWCGAVSPSADSPCL